MALSVIRKLYSSDEACNDGVLGLLRNGDVDLFGPDNVKLPDWRWRELLASSNTEMWAALTLSLTQQGAARIG